MKLEQIIDQIRNGKIARRRNWCPELVIFMQVPANITCENTWNMKSLPGDMKVFLKENNLSISYEDQYIIYDADDKTATYYVFDGEDINANDWEIIDPFNYDIFGK